MNVIAELDQMVEAPKAAPFECPADHQHGRITNSCYRNHKCRCGRCRGANARTVRDMRRQVAYGTYVSPTVPAIGTLRRLQALQLNGWSLTRLSALLGRDQSSMWRLMRAQVVTRKTHAKVAAVFAQLWDTQAPHETRFDLGAYNRTRNTATRNGYVGALAWDDIDADEFPASTDPEIDADDDVDEIAVELAVEGRKIPLTHAEKVAAIPGLHARRWSAARISQHLGLSERTIQRHRAALHLEPFAFDEIKQQEAA